MMPFLVATPVFQAITQFVEEYLEWRFPQNHHVRELSVGYNIICTKLNHNNCISHFNMFLNDTVSSKGVSQ